jgi:hypothetical protein
MKQKGGRPLWFLPFVLIRGDVLADMGADVSQRRLYLPRVFGRAPTQGAAAFIGAS